jgi:arylsulfatase A-like enzyme
MTNSTETKTLNTALSRVWIGLTSALVAGTLVGILESIVVVKSGSDLKDWWLFCWAAVTYGLIALPIGFGFGILGAILSNFRNKASHISRAFSFYLSITFIVMLLVISRFRIIRDVYGEISPGMSLEIKLIAGAIVLFILLHHLIFRVLFSISPFRKFASGFGGLVSYIFLIIVTVIISFSGTAPGEEADLGLLNSSTLRADHLPIYGYEAIETPAFDKLAADGILYRKAFSQASWTKPSIASILTGLYPSTHQAIHKNSLLPGKVTTLAEALETADYFTVGIPNNENIFPLRNFQQGFQVYDVLEPDFFFFATESAFHLTFYNQLRLIRERFLFQSKKVEHYYQDAAVVNQHTRSWLDQVRDGRFFLFIHYMEPHDPYFVHPYDGTGYARVSNPNPPPDLAQLYLETYDEEIVYLDRYLGELINHLEEMGLYDDLMIVLTSDHGEEFYEHEGWWHGTTLYEEQIYIPLIIKLPGNEAAGTEVFELVRSIDIAPTILYATGSDVPFTMQGQDILPDSLNIVAGQEFVFSEEDLEGNILQSVRGHEWKLIVSNEGNPRGTAPEELYNLGSDPAEETNISSGERAIVDSLRSYALDTSTFALEVSVEAEEREHSDVERERLKALGYVQ